MTRTLHMIEHAAQASLASPACSFVALSRVCPHQGSIVNVNGSGFLCPGHGATFTATGTWTGGQRTTNLHAYATSYDAASGVVTITG